MAKKPSTAPIIIMEASRQPYLSIGVRYGGVKAFGADYFYHPIKDAYIRKDWMNKMRGKSWEQFLEEVKAVPTNTTQDNG